uniref:Ion transport peptide transcript b n=1 Tax=Carabus violaceus TaxID=41075 RepID=A0A7U3MCA1_CARVO|nr:ion transport peptide transcript b [Carabus violaceus]
MPQVHSSAAAAACSSAASSTGKSVFPSTVRYAVWLMALCALAAAVAVTGASPASERTTHYTNQQSTVVLPVHHLTKRSFFDIQCKGVYDKSIFARLDRLCEDCYNLFREPQIHTLCRSQCFSTQYFKGCLESLLLTEESDQFNQMVEYLGKRSNN